MLLRFTPMEMWQWMWFPMMFMMAGWVIIGIAIAVWVYRDAEARGEDGAIWLLIVLFTSIIGLIIWLIVRPKERVVGKKLARPAEGKIYCIHCGTENPADAKYCHRCGKELK